METTAPETNIHVVNGPPKRVIVAERAIRHLTGFFYHLAFVETLVCLILPIIAILKDDLTKLRFHSNNASYVEYCGWRDIHAYDSSVAYLGNLYSFSYSKNCGDYNKACTLQTIGTVWYSLLIIGIVFVGFSLITFIFDLPALLARTLIIVFNFIFFACMFVDALIWGIYKTCHKACNLLDFPGLPTTITNCTPHWGASWILVIIAGGLAILSIIALMLSRSIPKI